MADLKDVVDKVKKTDQGEDDSQQATKQILVFDIDKEEYGAPIEDLQEIIKMPEVTPVPNTPDFIKGIINLRGSIVVIVDMEKRFKLVREKDTAQQHIIVLQVQDNLFGVMVDSVKEVLEVADDQLRKSPDLVSSKIHQEYIDGVIVIDKENKKEDEGDDKKTESRLIILMDLKDLLQEEELLEIGASVQKADNN